MSGRALSFSRPLLWSVAAVGVAAAVGLVTYWRQPPAPVVTTTSAPATAPAPAPPTLATIVSEARELKLITWSFETEVDAQSVSDRWYGDSIASVRAPVKYQYGVDLASLGEDAVFRDPATGELTFIVATPRRLSVEIDLERLEQSLKTSGLRWKARNQGQLDETRAQLGTVAKHLELSPRDDQRMREASREQIERHLRQVLGRIEPGVVVGVRFGK